MIYVSTACLKNFATIDAVELLQKNGIRNIELSGCTNDLEDFDVLIEAKSKYDLNYICHNYFFSTKEDFVLNLASLDDDIYQKTLAYFKNAIKLSNKLNSEKYGLHAGFFIDINVAEIGNKLKQKTLSDKDKLMQRFCYGFNILKKEAQGLELYIENNVISCGNLKTFNETNPLMLTNYEEYTELKKHISFKLLLDVGHLKVSANSLNLSFEDELDKLIGFSDYLHLSDNDALSDQNKYLTDNGNLLKLLKSYDLRNKIITLEIDGDCKNIKDSYNLMEMLITNCAN